MIELAIIAGVGMGTFLLWHKVHTANQPQLPIYRGAPAWPTMNPVPVPDVGLPYGVQQAPTYYGVSDALLEPFLK